MPLGNYTEGDEKPVTTGFDFFSPDLLLFSSFGRGVGAWDLRQNQYDQIKGENDDFVETAFLYQQNKVVISDQHKVIIFD